MTDEKTIGTIGTYTMKFSLSATEAGEIYQLLCFTPGRIIVAEMGSFTPVGNWKVSDFFLGSRKWRLSKLNSPLRAEAREKAVTRAGQLGRLPVESMIESDKANFHIAFEEIVKVQMMRPNQIMGTAWLTIITKTQKYQFGILNKDDFDNQSDLIRSVLNDKLTIS